jgi:hypothetical protein
LRERSYLARSPITCGPGSVMKLGNASISIKRLDRVESETNEQSKLEASNYDSDGQLHDAISNIAFLILLHYSIPSFNHTFSTQR